MKDFNVMERSTPAFTADLGALAKLLSQVSAVRAVPHLEADRMMHPQSTLPTDGGLP